MVTNDWCIILNDWEQPTASEEFIASLSVFANSIVVAQSIRARGDKNFFKLSSAEHEISTTHKC